LLTATVTVLDVQLREFAEQHVVPRLLRSIQEVFDSRRRASAKRRLPRRIEPVGDCIDPANDWVVKRFFPLIILGHDGGPR
jgi:hypothetical protein